MSKLRTRLPAPAATALLSALLLACGGGGGAQPMGCGGDGTTDPCAPTGRCLGGACVENAAPVAAFVAPAGLRALDLVVLDGSASSDPDAALGDGIASWSWTFTAVGAPCTGPIVSGHARVAQVRFPCAGRFAVQLVVMDELGKASEPSVQEVDVAAGSSLVQLGQDQLVNHRCAGNPATCTTDGGDPIVTATVGVAPVGALRYTWSARNPGSGALGDHRLVSFPAGAPAGSTKVHIETDGPYVVDDWPVDVAVSDDAGSLGTATTRISVGNRPPTVAAAAAAASVDHAFFGGSYRASAAGARFQDPDGDLLTPVSSQTGSTTCPSFTLAADGTAQLACQRAFGGTLGLSGFVTTHAVSQQVKDPWNAISAVTSTAVTIGNRATTAASTTVSALRSCQEGRCCQTEPEPPHTCAVYATTCAALAAKPQASISDPDGDPVLLSWVSGSLGTGASVCELGSCTGAYDVPGGGGCAGPPSGSAAGTFTATDGLTTSGQATLTLTW